jgi:hypothetical protein
MEVDERLISTSGWGPLTIRRAVRAATANFRSGPPRPPNRSSVWEWQNVTVASCPNSNRLSGFAEDGAAADHDRLLGGTAVRHR